MKNRTDLMRRALIISRCRTKRLQISRALPERLSVLPDALLSVLVFAGAAFDELDEPLPETRLEGMRHPWGRSANDHALRDGDGQQRGFRRFVVHVASFAVDLR